LFNGEICNSLYADNLLVIKIGLGGKKTKGEQTNYVCSPDVDGIGEELGLGTKSVSLERRRKSNLIILEN
jgi:hypothetical protein